MLGMMKVEAGGKRMSEYVALRANKRVTFDNYKTLPV